MPDLTYLSLPEVRALQYPDRADYAAAHDVILAVYVPVPGAHRSLAPASGLVGDFFPDETGRIVCCYEGASHNGAGVYTDLLHTAASRSMTGYPTTARMAVPPSTLHRVGTYRCATATYTISDQDALDRWLSQST